MAYEVALAVSSVLISFILIYISTMLDKRDYPGFQLLFFTAGLLFIIISIFTCSVIASENANDDLFNMFNTAMTATVFLFLLVIMFYFFKFWKYVTSGMYGKKDDDDD